MDKVWNVIWIWWKIRRTLAQLSLWRKLLALSLVYWEKTLNWGKIITLLSMGLLASYVLIKFCFFSLQTEIWRTVHCIIDPLLNYCHTTLFLVTYLNVVYVWSRILNFWNNLVRIWIWAILICISFCLLYLICYKIIERELVLYSFAIICLNWCKWFQFNFKAWNYSKDINHHMLLSFLVGVHTGRVWDRKSVV